MWGLELGLGVRVGVGVVENVEWVGVGLGVEEFWFEVGTRAVREVYGSASAHTSPENTPLVTHPHESVAHSRVHLPARQHTSA